MVAVKEEEEEEEEEGRRSDYLNAENGLFGVSVLFANLVVFAAFAAFAAISTLVLNLSETRSPFEWFIFGNARKIDVRRFISKFRLQPFRPLGATDLPNPKERRALGGNLFCLVASFCCCPSCFGRHPFACVSLAERTSSEDPTATDIATVTPL